MNVEIGAEAAQFPEKEYINGIAVAVLTPASKAPISWISDAQVQSSCLCKLAEGKEVEPNKTTTKSAGLFQYILYTFSPI